VAAGTEISLILVPIYADKLYKKQVDRVTHYQIEILS